MNELSQQDQEFVKGIVLTGNQTQSAKDAYGIEKDDYAGKKGSLKVRESKIATAITEVKRTMAEQIPDDLLIKVHIEGLNATSGIGDNTQPDYGVRHKYLDTAHKIKGTYAPEKSIALNVNADITNPKARELADKYEEELKKNL